MTFATFFGKEKQNFTCHDFLKTHFDKYNYLFVSNLSVNFVRSWFIFINVENLYNIYI